MPVFRPAMHVVQFYIMQMMWLPNLPTRLNLTNMDGNEITLDKIYASDLRDVALQDKYDLNKSTVFVSGTQALVRLCLLQAEKDRKAGLNTAGYVTGYRGSPLGGIDLQFSQAEQALTQAGVTFHPGLNEDLAATAVWGLSLIHI